jgi:two-component system response regulator PilR (NtrC family)
VRSDREGFFQAANGGTLFLDEVADLPLAMQVKLLRAIQEKRVRKVGSVTEEPVDVRIICATHRNLRECVDKGAFRQDLYYRLNVIELRMPPLRERLEDIAPLVDSVLQRLFGGASPGLSAGALKALQLYRFPGNVRELENILERATALCSGDLIEAEDLHLDAG